MLSLTKGSKGQALVEFTLCAMIANVALTLAAFLLQSQWNRGKCAYLVFESVHSQLVGRSYPVYSNIKIQETEDRVIGVGRCGNSKERVELPKLEAAEW